MTIANGKSRLQRIAFEVGGRTFRFALNPESMEEARPHRTTALKTKSRIIVEDFQDDIPTLTISGTTGFNPTGQSSDRGVNKIKEMKKFIADFSATGGNGKLSKNEFFFHNFTNDESHVVTLAPEGITISQDAQSPLLYRYSMKFIIIRASSEPADADVVNPEIGNKFPTLPDSGNYRPSPNYPKLPTPFPNGETSVPIPTRPSGDGSVGDDVYNKGNGGSYNPKNDNATVNPQISNGGAYNFGTTGLGYSIGYYGRWS
ncbi:hypothetical protein DIRTYBETTY_113 [Bacillus phage DirtyBetty]|uniref:Baseplate protein n=1 Tax=Bacillus phage DirtyBetty TaxID=1873999 RepID=A0A1B1PB80_9CAUD|nr:virion structural protein [Bacillus phage DirtyBetty]ANT41422.1 hypothetical protein DIRTYBETTY_113 [Bacillus phage DirtyBetty]